MKLHELEKNIGAKQRRKIVGRGQVVVLEKLVVKDKKDKTLVVVEE